MNDTNSAVILLLSRKLVDYYIPKGFVLHENNSSVMNNAPHFAKQIITARHIFINDYVMACYSVIPSTNNILIRITVCSSFTHNLHQRTTK